MRRFRARSLVSALVIALGVLLGLGGLIALVAIIAALYLL